MSHLKSKKARRENGAKAVTSLATPPGHHSTSPAPRRHQPPSPLHPGQHIPNYPVYEPSPYPQSTLRNDGHGGHETPRTTPSRHPVATPQKKKSRVPHRDRSEEAERKPCRLSPFWTMGRVLELVQRSVHLIEVLDGSAPLEKPRKTREKKKRKPAASPQQGEAEMTKQSTPPRRAASNTKQPLCPTLIRNHVESQEPHGVIYRPTFGENHRQRCSDPVKLFHNMDKEWKKDPFLKQLTKGRRPTLQWKFRDVRQHPCQSSNLSRAHCRPCNNRVSSEDRKMSDVRKVLQEGQPLVDRQQTQSTPDLSRTARPNTTDSCVQTVPESEVQCTKEPQVGDAEVDADVEGDVDADEEVEPEVEANGEAEEEADDEAEVEADGEGEPLRDTHHCNGCSQYYHQGFPPVRYPYCYVQTGYDDWMAWYGRNAYDSGTESAEENKEIEEGGQPSPEKPSPVVKANGRSHPSADRPEHHLSRQQHHHQHQHQHHQHQHHHHQHPWPVPFVHHHHHCCDCPPPAPRPHPSFFQTYLSYTCNVTPAAPNQHTRHCKSCKASPPPHNIQVAEPTDPDPFWVQDWVNGQQGISERNGGDAVHSHEVPIPEAVHGGGGGHSSADIKQSARGAATQAGKP